jgi:toxin ParE1/3/4
MTSAALSPAARRDLLDAIRWIAYDNPAAARGLRTAVLKAAGHIGDYAFFGVERPDIAGDPFRFVMLIGYPL